MKIREIRDKSKEELEKMLLEKQAKLCQLRFDIRSRQIKNYKQIGKIRKEIARIKTILKEFQAKKPSTN